MPAAAPRLPDGEDDAAQHLLRDAHGPGASGQQRLPGHARRPQGAGATGAGRSGPHLPGARFARWGPRAASRTCSR